MTDKKPKQHRYTSASASLRLLTHLGPVQFVEGGFETTDQELAVEIDKQAQKPELAITKES